MTALLNTVPTPEVEAAPKKRGGGPRTQEGRDQSRCNALKHGMRAKLLLPDDLAAAVALRRDQLAAEFGPSTAYEDWLVGEMALASARLDRCAEMALVDLQRGIDRALLCWDMDRRKLVEDLGARLPKDPSRVSRALERCRQGADWLIERWEALGEIVATKGGWEEAQRRLAFDLLGVPADSATAARRVPAADDAEGLSALVAEQIERLRADQEESLDRLDESERLMAAAGMPLDEDAATRRLRRHESSCRRAMYWARAELIRAREGAPLASAMPPEPPCLPPSTERSCSVQPKPPCPPALAWPTPLPTPAAVADEPPTKPEPEPETEPVAITPVAAERVAAESFAIEPVASRPAFASSRGLSPAPRNRRERKAQESRERRASRTGSPAR